MSLDRHPRLDRPFLPAEVRGPACVPNIGPAERWRRMRFGLISWAIGAAATAGLVASGADWRLRLLLFLPFVGGASGFFQARDRT